MTPEERRMMMEMERLQQMRAPNAAIAALNTPEALAQQERFRAGMQDAMQPRPQVGPAPGSRPPNPFVRGLSQLGRRFMDVAQDPVAMAQLAQGFNTLRFRPDQQLAQGLQQRIQTVQSQRQQAQQANVTAEYFRQQGQPQIADLVERVPGIGAEALKTLFREPAKTPSILQEYLFAVSQNPELTYEQFLNLKESGTTVNIPPPDVAGEAAMKQLPVAFKEVTDTGANARAQLNAIGQLGRALSGIETGGFAETKKSLLGLADRLGVQVDTDELGRLQAVDAIASQLVAAELRQNKGPQTDFDARFTQTFLPGLGQQKSANEAIISYMNSRNLRDALIGTYASANRRFDANDVNVMRNVNIIRQTVGSVIYKDNDPVTLEEFVSANRAAGKSDSEILLNWYAEHDPRGAAAMRGVQ